MNFLIKLLVSTLAVIITAYLLPGVTIDNDSVLIAIVVAAVLAFLNSIVKPVMIFLTIPFTIFTFGFFLLAINAFIIMIADRLIDGFHVRNFWWALLFSIVMWLVNSILQGVQRRDNRK